MINKNNLMQISENRKILIQGQNFIYLLPCKELVNLISNFTITFPDRAMISDHYTIMPHGSVTLVFFSFKNGLHSFLFGPATKPIKVGDIANKCEAIFIIEFQPAGFSPFNKINQNELCDKIVPFSLIDTSLDTAMRSIFNGSFSVDGLLHEMEKKLLQSMQFQYPGELVLAIQTMIRMEGNLDSAEISKNVFYCPRHLNRLFHQYVGMGVKSFTRLIRINKSFHLLNQKANTLSHICEKLGYYDVSHFVRDFKMICNITPQEYRTNMSDFYSEIAKF